MAESVGEFIEVTLMEKDGKPTRSRILVRKASVSCAAELSGGGCLLVPMAEETVLKVSDSFDSVKEALR